MKGKTKKMFNIKSLVIAAFFLLVSMNLSAGVVTGVVHAINFNKHPGWNGVMFQLKSDNGTLITTDPECGNHTWGFMRIENDLDKAILSALITSKATNQKVKVGLSGCLNPPEVLSAMPVVQWLDFGIRD